MKDTFDLRKYLVENKMTENSRKGARRRLDGTVLTESCSGDEGRFLRRRTVSEAKKGIAKPTWDEVKVWVSRYGDAGAAKRIKITYPEFVEKCGSPEKALYAIKPSAIRSMDRHNSKMRDAEERARERRMGNSGDHSRRDTDDRNNREKNGYDNPMIPSETGHFMGR